MNVFFRYVMLVVCAWGTMGMSPVFAAARIASVSGNWNSTATWGGAAVPVAADTITINAGVIVTVNVASASCTAITNLAANTANGIVILGTNALDVSGPIVTVVPTANNRNTTINVGGGSLSAGSIALAGAGTASRYTELLISTGTVDVVGDITSAGIASRVTFTDAGRINISGSFLSGTAGTFTPSTGTINYNLNGNQTVEDYAYYSLTLSAGGTKTPAANLVVNGVLRIASCTLNMGTYLLSGSFTTTGNAAGTLQVRNLSSTPIPAGKSWDFKVTYLGAGAQTIVSGTYKRANPSLQIQNNQNNTVSGNIAMEFGALRLVGTSTFDMNGYNITFSGADPTTGIYKDSGATFTPGSGIVTYDSSGDQTIWNTAGSAITYNNLVLSGSGVKTNPAGTEVTGNLSISGCTASLATGDNVGAGTLTLGGLGRTNGTWGSTSSSATYKTNTYFEATTGFVTVSNDSRSFATVTAWPTASGITYGQALSDSTLSGGSAAVAGSFAFTTPATTPNAGTYAASVTFTPSDQTTYKATNNNVNVSVAKANSSVSVWPTASAITYGQTLASSSLSGGSGSPAGSFAFTTPTNVPAFGTSSQSVTYTPTDSANYNTTVGSVNVTANQKSLTPTVTLNNKVYDGTTDPATIASRSLSGIVGSDDVTLGSSGSVAAFGSRNVGGYTPSVTGLSLSGTDAAKYTLSTTTVSPGASITARPVSVTAATDSKTYDGTTSSAGTPTLTSGSIASGDSAPTWTQTFTTKHVGTGKTLVPAGVVSDGNSGNNYNVTFVNDTTGEVTARAITVTAATDSKTYDGTTTSSGTPTLTSGTMGSGDTEPTWTQTFNTKHAGSGKALVPAGTVSDGNGGNNYNVTFVNNNTGVITARALTITAAANSKGYDGNTSSATLPTITSGAVQSGDTASFIQTYDTAAVGTSKTLTPSGTVTDGNSGSNYSYTFVPANVGTITGGTVTKLLFTSSPISVMSNVTSGTITVERQDALGNPNSTEGSRTVTLSSDSSGTVTFTPSSLTITSGSSVATFTYRDTVAGFPTITAASTSPTTITSATQQVTVYGTAFSSTWDGGGANDLWNNATNWGSNIALIPSNVLHFAGSTRLTPSNNLPAATAFNSIFFDSGAASFTLSGNQISLDLYIENNSANPQYITLPINVNSGRTLQVRTILGSGDLTISGVISGEGGVEKQVYAGATTSAILSGSNTYSGATTILAGRLTISSIKNVGSSEPSSLGMPTPANSTISMGVGIDSTLIYTGTGDTTDRGINLGGSGDIELVHNGSGLLQFTGPFSASADFIHKIIFGGSGTAQFDSAIIDAASNFTRIEKRGSGTWTLTGTNTFGGTTAIEEGTLVIGGSGSFGGGSYTRNIPVNGNLVYASSANQTFSGVLSGTGVIVMAGSGIMTLSGANTFSGSTVVSNGTLLMKGTYAGLIEVPAGAVLAGTGSVGRVLLRGGLLNPGLSPGTLSVASLELTNGTYRVEVTNATGTAGVNWDLINVGSGAGVVTNSATSGDPVTIDLHCDLASLPGFYGTNAISWTIIDAGNHVGFASNKFIISTSNFTPVEKYNGAFTVSSNAGDLVINFTPYAPVDLGLSASVSPFYVAYGDTNLFTFVVTNNSLTASGFYYVTNSLSTNISYHVAYSTTNMFAVVTHYTADGGVYSGGTYNNGKYVGGYVTWTLNSLGGGASTTLILTAIQSTLTDSTQQVSNVSTVTVSSSISDPNPSNNSASTSFTSVGIPMLSTLAMLILTGVIAYVFYRRNRQTAEA